MKPPLIQADANLRDDDDRIASASPGGPFTTPPVETDRFAKAAEQNPTLRDDLDALRRKLTAAEMAALADALLATARATGELPKGPPPYLPSSEAIGMARMYASQIVRLQQAEDAALEANVKHLEDVVPIAVKDVASLLAGPSPEGRMVRARSLLNQEIEAAQIDHTKE